MNENEAHIQAIGAATLFISWRCFAAFDTQEMLLAIDDAMLQAIYFAALIAESERHGKAYY